jgi:hypothetical protein
MSITLISRTTSIVVRPSLPSQLGNGTVTGSFDGTTWTPGRNEDGVVNSVSYALVPRGIGIRVAGTRLDGLDAAVKAAVPGWRDWGVEGWDGVMKAWNGFTIDPSGNRLWMVCGGGHAASSNNGIYRFDVLKMEWSIEKAPSDPTPWSEQYKGTGRRGESYTFCAEAHEESEARRSAGTLSPVNDWFFDELPWDRQPTSRHNYSATVYVPQTNEIVMCVRRFWRYSLATGQWTYKRQIEDGARPYAGSGVFLIHDESRDEVLFGGYGDSYYNSTGYHLAGNRWTPWAQPVGNNVVADTRYGRRWTAIAPPEAPTSGYPRNGAYWVYDLDSRQVINSGSVQYGEGLTRESFAKSHWYYDGFALCYIPTINRYWLCTRMSDGSMPILELDPTTTPWTLRRQSLAGVDPQPYAVLCRKMVYVPALDAVLLADAATKDFWLYRF